MAPANRAVEQYIGQYALLQDRIPALESSWEHVLVVPCYDESPEFIAAWQQVFSQTSLLIVLVLNRPDSSQAGVNLPVKNALKAYPTTLLHTGYSLHQLSPLCSLLSVDLEAIEGCTPIKEGVGRARRIGCDLALRLQRDGVVQSPWIYSGDADAQWPANLFTRQWPSKASAVVVPFTHRISEAPKAEEVAGVINSGTVAATLLYELKLHHYVLHLQSMGSPYGFYTLGSNCVFRAEAYASVRGMPLRSAAEDFYLLNKLAKVAPIHQATGMGITIKPRLSSRVPFGTGPAVAKLLESNDLLAVPIFYDTRCFSTLATLRELFEGWTNTPNPKPQKQLLEHFGNAMGADLHNLLAQWGYEKAIAHIQRAGAHQAQRSKHSNTWFDGFKILKIIHRLRDRHYPNLSFSESAKDPSQWPVTHDGSPEGLLDGIHRHLKWFNL